MWFLLFIGHMVEKSSEHVASRYGNYGEQKSDGQVFGKRCVDVPHRLDHEFPNQYGNDEPNCGVRH
jgi:hypothetical protein